MNQEKGEGNLKMSKRKKINDYILDLQDKSITLSVLAVNEVDYKISSELHKEQDKTYKKWQFMKKLNEKMNKNGK